MSNNTRNAAVRQILAQNARLLALLEGESVADEATTTTTTRATRKAAAPKKGKKAKAAKREVTFQELREALRQHKAAGAIEAGVSVKVAIERGLMDANGVLTGAPKAAPKAERRVVAEVKPERKAKTTRKARKAPEGPRNADGPRDAQGHITPRSEWALREALIETGQFDRFEVDALVRGEAVQGHTAIVDGRAVRA